MLLCCLSNKINVITEYNNVIDICAHFSRWFKSYPMKNNMPWKFKKLYSDNAQNLKMKINK